MGGSHTGNAAADNRALARRATTAEHAGMRLPPAKLVPSYLWLQAMLVAGWWLVLWLAPTARTPFVVGAWPEATLLAFAVPDLAVLVLGSGTAAHGLAHDRPWARPLLWLVAGAACYATLWCLGANLATGSGWLSTAMMAPCAAAMVWAVAVVR